MQIPVLQGIYADAVADFRTSYPRNMIPVPKATGIAQGFLRPADGIEAFATGQGVDRGAINWKGSCYRVSGSALIKVGSNGTSILLGDVGMAGQVTMDYGPDCLAIASGGSLYYWDGATLSQVTDPDLGAVVDMRWIAGYFMTTDGTNIIVTELTDRMAVNPLKYGSAESDPDPVLAVDELRNEAYWLGRYTIEVGENVGGDLFPFARIEGAQVPRGIIGTHAYSQFLNTFAFLGSARNEAPAVYLMLPGDTDKISTAEVDQLLLEYTEAELSLAVMETRIDKGHSHLLLHLPDQCLVYDAAASKVLGTPVWFTLTSSVVGRGAYRARNLCWCYDRWICGDPTGPGIGRLTDTTAQHFGAVNGWDFGTLMIYNEGNDAIVHELELVGLPGRVAFGADPVVWTSYSLDGETWGQEHAISAGRAGQRNKRLAWRKQGKLGLYRIQRFRGTSDARMSIARLEARLEPLITRPGGG